jgi:hypothetical protein
VVDISAYRFIKVTRNSELRHLLTEEHIRRILPMGVIID